MDAAAPQMAEADAAAWERSRASWLAKLDAAPSYHVTPNDVDLFPFGIEFADEWFDIDYIDLPRDAAVSCTFEMVFLDPSASPDTELSDWTSLSQFVLDLTGGFGAFIERQEPGRMIVSFDYDYGGDGGRIAALIAAVKSRLIRERDDLVEDTATFLQQSRRGLVATRAARADEWRPGGRAHARLVSRHDQVSREQDGAQAGGSFSVPWLLPLTSSLVSIWSAVHGSSL